MENKIDINEELEAAPQLSPAQAVRLVFEARAIDMRPYKDICDFLSDGEWIWANHLFTRFDDANSNVEEKLHFLHGQGLLEWDGPNCRLKPLNIGPAEELSLRPYKEGAMRECFQRAHITTTAGRKALFQALHLLRAWRTVEQIAAHIGESKQYRTSQRLEEFVKHGLALRRADDRYRIIPPELPQEDIAHMLEEVALLLRDTLEGSSRHLHSENHSPPSLEYGGPGGKTASAYTPTREPAETPRDILREQDVDEEWAEVMGVGYFLDHDDTDPEYYKKRRRRSREEALGQLRRDLRSMEKKHPFYPPWGVNRAT